MWIPIDKRLPNLLENILVTVEHQHRWVSFAWFGSDQSWHYADSGEKIAKEFKIIAWKSLPEPYNGIK